MRVSLFGINMGPEEDKPIGGLLFADPSVASMTEQINLHDHPANRNASPTSPVGIRTMTGSHCNYRDRTSAGSTTGNAWSAMNKKRGVNDPEEEDK